MIKNKKALIFSIVGLVVIVGAAAGTMAVLQYMRNNDPNSVPSDSNYVTDKDQPLTDGTTPSEDKVITPQPQPSDQGASPEKPNITRAEQSGDFIRVSAVLSNASSGNCLLTLQKTGAPTLTHTAAVIVGPSYYTCNGFRIPRSELAAPGEWTAVVTHQLNGKSTVSDTKTITVQ